MERVRSTLSDSRKMRWVNMSMSVLGTILFIVLAFMVIKAQKVVLEGVKEQIVTVHDTVYVKPTPVYKCWVCGMELKLTSGKAICDGYEYSIVDGKLMGSKVEIESPP